MRLTLTVVSAKSRFSGRNARQDGLEVPGGDAVAIVAIARQQE